MYLYTLDDILPFYIAHFHKHQHQHNCDMNLNAQNRYVEHAARTGSRLKN